MSCAWVTGAKSTIEASGLNPYPNPGSAEREVSIFIFSARDSVVANLTTAITSLITSAVKIAGFSRLCAIGQGCPETVAQYAN